MKNLRNNSILKVGLMFIVISYIINALYFMNLSIEEPVFLKHYYETSLNKRPVIALHLITNSDDIREIIAIEFPQLPEDFAYVSLNNVWRNNNGYDRIEKFAHYHYKILYFEFLKSNDDLLKYEESIVLDKATIIYNNGDVQNVNIGKIILYDYLKYMNSLISDLHPHPVILHQSYFLKL